MDKKQFSTSAIWAILKSENSLSAYERLVATDLAMHANGEGKSFPSIDAIASECAISANTVRKAIKGLVAAGLIQVIERSGTTKIFCFSEEMLTKARDKQGAQTDVTPSRGEKWGSPREWLGFTR